MKKAGLHILPTFLGLMFIIPCGQAGEAGSDAPTFSELENATYSGIEDDPVSLINGYWQGKPFVEGGSARPSVGLLKDVHLASDLDGDGKQEAVVILWQNSGGTGSYSHIAIMTGTDNAISNMDTALIGDRIKLRRWQVTDGKIVLDVLQAGENDAMCCPGTLATRTWTLEDMHLKEGPTKITGELSLAALENTRWLLTHMDHQTLIKNAEVTLNFQAGRIAGKSACNRYSATVTDGDNPGDIQIGPAMGTRMACTDYLMNVEREYLDVLSRASSFSFLTGSLLLSGQNSNGETFKLLLRPIETEMSQ
jgi:heat shock protein HslJ